jgi:hypothetical protein
MRGCRTCRQLRSRALVWNLFARPGHTEPGAGILDPSPSSRSGNPGVGQCGLAHVPDPGPLRCPPAQRGDVRPLQALARNVCEAHNGRKGASP